MDSFVGAPAPRMSACLGGVFLCDVAVILDLPPGVAGLGLYRPSAAFARTPDPSDPTAIRAKTRCTATLPRVAGAAGAHAMSADSAARGADRRDVAPVHPAFTGMMIERAASVEPAWLRRRASRGRCGGVSASSGEEVSVTDRE